MDQVQRRLGPTVGGVGQPNPKRSIADPGVMRVTLAPGPLAGRRQVRPEPIEGAQHARFAKQEQG